MRLAREQHAHVFVVEQLRQPRLVAQDKIAALVTRRPAREADEQRVLLQLDAVTILNLVDQRLFRLHVCGPDLVGVAARGADFGMLPRRLVHAVGDRADRAGVRDARPHGAGSLAVELRDRVRRSREAQAGHGHVERIAADRAHLGARQLQARAHAAQVRYRVFFVARPDRGVRGEDDLLAHLFPRLRELHARFHVLGDHLDAGEHGVTFVEVVGRDRIAEPGERAHTADAQQHFLCDARVGAGFVESVRDPAVLVADGIDEEELDVPKLFGYPDAALHLGSAHPDANADAGVLEVVRGEPGELLVRPAVGANALHAIAARPEQADGHHGQLQVACGLDVITGQDAEASRVDREGLVQAVFHAEVGDVG